MGSITLRIGDLARGTGLGTGFGVGEIFICESEYLTGGALARCCFWWCFGGVRFIVGV